MTIEEVRDCICTVYTNFVQRDGQKAEPYRIALEALDKQIGVPPLKIEGNGATHILCPKCNHRFYNLIVTFSGNPPPYCERCGQRIDWREEKTDDR